jgi:multidrug efflux pump subunit AcrA (membrane-fusion protein)
MPSVAPKVREDLEYLDQEIDGDEVVLVRDPIRGTYFRFNVLQGAMLRALDGHRTAAQITAVLSEQYEVEIPPEAAERFIARARDLMLLEITAYSTTSKAALAHVRRAMRRAGFQLRAPGPREAPRAGSAGTSRLAEAFAELERGHPRAAAGYLAEILARDPDDARARQLYELIQTAYIRAAGGTTDFPTWVMFNPSRLLTWLNRTIGDFLFSWMGVLAILAFCCIGGYAYANVSFEHVTFGPGAITVAVLLKLISGLLHEVGHGIACQRYGGNVTEIGFTLFYYVQPAFYCDTSSSYLINVRRHKMIVQLAGTVVSLLWMSALAIGMMFLKPTIPIYPGLALSLAFLSVLLFANLIPFVKFDGYYAICDYVGFPNLRDRSFKLARAWLSKRLLGIEVPTEALPPRTRVLLVTYAVISFLFTVLFIYLGYFRLLAPIVERFRGVGLLFAVVFTAGYLLRSATLRPVGNLVRLVVRERRRIFTRRRTAILLALAVAVVGPWFVPWPVLVDAEFVVVPHHRADVRAQAAGRVGEIFVAEGDHVRRGQPIATLRNAALHARIAVLEAEREVSAHHLERLRRGARPEELAVARRRLDHARSEVERTTDEARVASSLAAASLGSQASADLASGRVATSTGAAGAARWSLSLLEAGARPEDIAAAEAAHVRLERQLAHLHADEALLTLRSPIDGVVATPHLPDKLQAVLAPGDLFAEVHDLGAVIAEVPLSQGDPLGELAVGDLIALRPYGAPGDEVQARVERFRQVAQDGGDEPRIVAITSPFALARPITGLTGHARIYGAEHSLAYANFSLPFQRLVRVRLWSMW